MKFLSYILAIIAFVSFIYCAYFLAKNVSYYLWYDDMVKETVREMVKQEALKP